MTGGRLELAGGRGGQLLTGYEAFRCSAHTHGEVHKHKHSGAARRRSSPRAGRRMGQYHCEHIHILRAAAGEKDKRNEVTDKIDFDNCSRVCLINQGVSSK